MTIKFIILRSFVSNVVTNIL